MNVLLLLPLLFAPSPSKPKSFQLVEAARQQIGVTTSYDSKYQRISYPGGDVPQTTGVCSDVLVRALRSLNVDLQKMVHEDMQIAFSEYPKHWGLRSPDSNIDHRRVPNLMRFFERSGKKVAASTRAEDFQAGDIVAWDLGGGVTHIGIVSDQHTLLRTPLIIHNIGDGVKEENILFKYKIIGHYRYFND
jgi:hypothetical protein